MKMQRLALVLVASNLLLLALSFSPRLSSAAQATSPILRARTLELVDAHGRVRSRLNVESDEVVFRLFDETGTIRVKLAANQSGSGLVLLDETTALGVHIVARRAPMAGGLKTTSITLTGADGRQRVITP